MSDSDFYQLLNSSSSNIYRSPSTSDLAGAGIWVIIATILAIVGGILVYFLFVKSKTEPKGKFAKWLKDFLSFKVMWIEPIMKVVYYIATIFTILFSFTFLAAGGAGVLVFFITLILGPVITRIVYESFMMFIMIWHNTQEIADNTKKK
jgi:cellulose synthase/poly-beta-1,6-N-acetylglucosamine synthase-like glycosyltransferase